MSGDGLSHLITRKILQSEYYPHFSYEEAQAQRDGITCLNLSDSRASALNRCAMFQPHCELLRAGTFQPLLCIYQGTWHGKLKSWA